MFITADQLLLHAIGDYVLQSDWMASKKSLPTMEGYAAITAHAAWYTFPFIFLTNSAWALGFIFGTHWLIDHFKLARYIVWVKNFIGPPGSNYPWAECNATGYHKDRPPFMAVWLYIFCDNTMHVICNGIALKYFL